ncbi:MULTISPECIES: hypothetical protein [unclassified Streptomyces]|uniref:hypothetical protein n=1 Tax=unclassified Streptomyces TaxID=2593676 RepID=UPI00081DB185|nr:MULTISPECIES: hypothetical protein [unclassified Streptomyces]MYR92767.1 hypothetical protein [Streptomyces sp. SID4937]SCD39991.1 hypothetical protein GA0115243_1013122 [Streptomyces sp. ScaeMP-e83]
MNEYLSRAAFLDGKRDKGQSRADAFQRDERMENLDALRNSRPEVFEKLSPTILMSLGYYENDKKIAAAHGIDVNKGNR